MADDTPVKVAVPLAVPAVVAELLIVTDGLVIGMLVTVFIQGFFAVNSKQLGVNEIFAAKSVYPGEVFVCTFN